MTACIGARGKRSRAFPPFCFLPTHSLPLHHEGTYNHLRSLSRCYPRFRLPTYSSPLPLSTPERPSLTRSSPVVQQNHLPLTPTGASRSSSVGCRITTYRHLITSTSYNSVTSSRLTGKVRTSSSDVFALPR